MMDRLRVGGNTDENETNGQHETADDRLNVHLKLLLSGVGCYGSFHENELGTDYMRMS